MEHVYFTWPDRRFRYECRGCGACCKGHGIGLDVAGGQLVQLLARRPALAAFLRRRGEAITAFNPRDRCWFLADDGLCRVEVEDGRAAKPASCRLFPFNRVFRLGPYTIVDYNSVICPLTVGDDGITHAEVTAEIASITDPTIIGTPLPARDPDAEGRAFVESERAIAAALFASPGDLSAAWIAQAEAPALSCERDAAAASVATTVPGRERDIATTTSSTALTRERDVVTALTRERNIATPVTRERDIATTTASATALTRERGVATTTASAAVLNRERDVANAAFTVLLGTAWQPPSSPTLTAAIWLTPSLRFNELYGPRQYTPRSPPTLTLPRMWLAWLGFAALGEQLASRPLGLQELTTLWAEQAPLMHAIARWTDAPTLKPGPIDLPGADPRNLVRSLAQSFVDNRKAKKPLGDLVAALPNDPASRVTALKSAESLLRTAFTGR